MITIKAPDLIHNDDIFNLDTIEERGGVYVFYNKDNTPVYIGHTDNLKQRIYYHLRGGSNTGPFCGTFETASYFFEDDPVHRDIYETYLINNLKPLYNVKKAYTYKPTPSKMEAARSFPERKQLKREKCSMETIWGRQCKNWALEDGLCHVHKHHLQKKQA